MKNIDPYFGNNVGDNLTEEHEDDQDENEAYNWVNNPIRKLFENPKNQYERTYLESPIPADD